MKDEALTLALEALEDSVDLVREDYENAKKLYGNYPSRQARLLGMEDGLSKHEAAITAIKQALAASVPVKTFHGGKPWPLHPAPVQESIEDFKKRLAAAIDAMPFGDTAASFAVFIRDFK